MTDHLPTIRDEEWRYADAGVLKGLSPATFEAWHDIDVAEGETHRDCFVLNGGEPELRRIRARVAPGARLELFAVIAAQDYARVEVVVNLGEGAHFEFGGVTIGGGDAVREFVTRTDHGHPDATSNQTVRAVHWGQATGNFLGRIDVGRDGQRTDAAQSFKGLLLERGASANAKPELEIYADDVKCEHGAAIGQMDEQARYYMASRGIAPGAAQRLLTRAFIADAFMMLDDEAARERLLDLAVDTLAKAQL
ncbi:SufD family Fe-S cluster assembly protein [Aurantiacibacter spongiae]|uniref:SufD family Fe-S cluster assembly protein n=1 Tax=Aurantiacibacter spongiae TaxID=2488860 RepID=A0A3N5CQS5_9SPHN|nr:SufD family Fe-S cluster assembly protein [Aurantiacibacter spongiae]RPF71433.1 SufD family Fe-S cluster assembly protein [Aurantiacibacter spongiae]